MSVGVVLTLVALGVGGRLPGGKLASERTPTFASPGACHSRLGLGAEEVVLHFSLQVFDQGHPPSGQAFGGGLS